MIELTTLIRRWFIFSVVVMTSFGAVFLGLLNWRMFRSIEDSRSRVTALLAADIEKDLIRISEEMVLNLGSLKARERLYQEIVGTAGVVTIEIAPLEAACAGKGWRDSRDLSVYRAELRFDDLLVGCLEASVTWSDNLATSGLHRMVASSIAALVTAALVWLFAFRLFRYRLLEPMLQTIRERERHLAVANMTQMIAHDVRKPFSMLKIGLDRMASIGGDPAQAKELSIKIREHVGRAFESVNGMLSDVMEVSSGETKLQCEALSLSAIAENALSQVFRYDAGCQIEFEYSFGHSSFLHADQLKVLRVFINILDNARQAMLHKKGVIWIRSRDLPRSNMIEVTLGNSNSLIPSESISKLFDAFFTSGKRGGTGLGLAIVYKIVTAHGGTIRCKSALETGTEFVFTLPGMFGTSDAQSIPLPRDSSEVRAAFEASLRSEPIQKIDVRDVERRQAIVSKSQLLGRPLEVFVVDDEEIYIDGIRGQLAKDEDLTRHVKLSFAMTPAEALELCRSRSFDLVISDIDLGKGEISGFELIRTIRELCPRTRTCIHSNRSIPENYRESVEAGADAFLPKPLGVEHLLGLLANVDVYSL